MQNTMQLLDRALEIKRAAKWASDLNLSSATFTMAKRRGRLSPSIAGYLAMNLGESAERWIAIAALEAEPETPLLQVLKSNFEQCRFTLFVPWRARCALTTHRAPRRFFYVCNWLR